MRTVWVMLSFFRSLESQAAQLLKLSGGSWPEELWILGGRTSPVLSLPGVRVRLLLSPAADTEAMLQVLVKACEHWPADVFLFPSDGESSALSTRLSCRLGGQSAAGVQSFAAGSGNTLSVKRLCYSGNMQAGLLLSRGPYCLSSGLSGGAVPPGICTLAPEDGQTVDFAPVPSFPYIDLSANGQADDLASARRVIALGLGVGSADNIPLFQQLAALMGAQLGASRPVVMNGWTPQGSLLGVSGTPVSPELCLVFGASGSAAFMAGIENSKFIVAVNTDPHAPIMRMADVCVNADCLETAKALIAVLEQRPEQLSAASCG